ncbi:MAG: PQQ-binding-like beta-propeller repeat protein [Acidobacteria bacterium]|nr:PQQ-binding-like beta-propeller repeat protein [Acidobacteriota bacterium]
MPSSSPRSAACPTRILPACLLAIGLPALGAPAVNAEDWPEYRGKGRRGVWTESGIVATLPADGLKVRWRTPINPGWSSPVVSGGRVFLTDFTRAENSTDVVERAVCLDEETGRILWTHTWEADYRTVGATWEGPRVTPTVDGDRVYYVGATGKLLSMDVASGAVVWTRDLMSEYDATPPMWGFSSAPLVDGPRLITIVGGEDNARVVVFDKRTGEEIWRALPADADIGVPVPIIIEAAGRPQLIIWFPEKVVSLDPATGELYWEEPTRTDFNMNITPPVRSGSRLLISSFYNGSTMLALDEDRPDAELVWKGQSNNEIATDGLHSVMTTPVILGDHIYGVGSFGQFRALDAVTGERLWETQALTGERARWASAFIVAHEDRFFINNDRGDLIIAKFSPAGYEEISRTPLIEPTSNSSNRRRLGGVNWVAASYANRHVLARNDDEVLSASLAAADYPDLPASATPVRRAEATPSADPEAADTGRPPLTMQFAASGTTTGDISTFEFGEFYVLSGRGFNTPVFVTDYGIVAVDPARSASYAEVRAELDRITEARFTTIVHTRAYAAEPEFLGGFPQLTEVVAQNDAAAALRRLNPLDGERARFAPTRTYDSALSLFDGRSRIELHHFGAGATGGDAVLVVPRFNMAYLGDLMPWKGVPLIDRDLGGSAVALPETLDQVVATLERAGVTFVVPGRAAPPFQQTILGWFTVDDVREYAVFCRELLAAVQEQLRRGGGVDDIAAGLAMVESFNGYDLQDAREYIEAVRAEMQ